MMNKIIEAITLVQTDWRERGFAFNNEKTTDIILGDCNEVTIPPIENKIGTFHIHTIDYSRPSEEDFKVFLNSNDKLFCYATPIEDLWRYRCYDRETSVVIENELEI